MDTLHLCEDCLSIYHDNEVEICFICRKFIVCIPCMLRGRIILAEVEGARKLFCCVGACYQKYLLNKAAYIDSICCKR